MENKIDIITSGEEIAVFGEEKSVERFFNSIAKSSDSRKLDLNKLGSFIHRIGDGAKAISEISESSGRWLQLTAESAQKVKDLGLMSSTKDGVKVTHAMLGEPGKIAGWLQVVVDPKSFLTNPAVLSGISNYLSQQALQVDLKFIKEMLITLDQKLDEVSRKQVIDELAILDGVILSIEDAKAKMAHNDGIVNAVTWSQLDAQAFEVGKLQGVALRTLLDIKDQALKLKDISSAPEKLEEMESNIAIWLTVLGRTMELREVLASFELAAVEQLNPDQLIKHTAGVSAAIQNRKSEIYEFIGNFLKEITKSSSLALDKVILHSKKANQTVNILNQITKTGHLFNSAFGDPVETQPLSVLSLQDALKEPKQIKTALVEVAKVGGSVVLASLVTIVAIAKVKDK